MNKILFTFSIFLAVACKPEQHHLTSEDAAKVVSEVKLLFDQYTDAVRKEGLTAEFKFLDHSPEFFWVPPGYETPISYDSVAAVLTLNAPTFISVENKLDTLRIIPLTHALATYTAKLHSVMNDTSGNVSALHLIETGLVIKRKDGWKLLNGQTSLIK